MSKEDVIPFIEVNITIDFKNIKQTKSSKKIKKSTKVKKRNKTKKPNFNIKFVDHPSGIISKYMEDWHKLIKVSEITSKG